MWNILQDQGISLHIAILLLDIRSNHMPDRIAFAGLVDFFSHWILFDVIFCLLSPEKILQVYLPLFGTVQRAYESLKKQKCCRLSRRARIALYRPVLMAVDRDCYQRVKWLEREWLGRRYYSVTRSRY